MQGNIKELLHNYYNQGFQNILNRYITTVEDELAKKYRDVIDREESKSLTRYSPKLLSEMLDEIGGFEKFHTGEVERSIVNMYGHLQGAVQRRISDMEAETNSILRRKTDVGALVRGENSYAIAKCSIRDNPHRSETVYDAVLAINILDSELISPIMHVQSLSADILKELTSDYVLEKLDRDIEKLNNSLVEEGKEEMTSNEMMFEKIKNLDKSFADDVDNSSSVRYEHLAKTVYDSLKDLADTIPPDEYDPLRIRENIKYVLDDVNVRNRGYNSAVNTITRVLDLSRMSYQHLENLKNRRSCVVREYSPSCGEYPDEDFVIHLDYYDMSQLKGMREAYHQQYEEFSNQVDQLSAVVDGKYASHKKGRGRLDFQDLRQEYLSEDAADLSNRLWNEITLVAADKTVVEEEHSTYSYDTELIKGRLVAMTNKIAIIYGATFPKEREVLSERLDELSIRFQEFAKLVNPFQIQPGLLLNINLTTIKRKQVTLHRMSNVLNEFLYQMSSGFSDPAFANFARRRSTAKAEEEDVYLMYKREESQELSSVDSDKMNPA